MIEMSIPCALISKITFVLTDISSNTLEDLSQLTSNLDLLISKILHSVEFIWETKFVIDENQPFSNIFPFPPTRFFPFPPPDFPSLKKPIGCVDKNDIEECINICKQWQNFRSMAKRCIRKRFSTDDLGSKSKKKRQNFFGKDEIILEAENSRDESGGSSRGKDSGGSRGDGGDAKGEGCDFKVSGLEKAGVGERYYLLIADCDGNVKEVGFESWEKFLEEEEFGGLGNVERKLHQRSILSIMSSECGKFLHTASIDKYLKTWEILNPGIPAMDLLADADKISLSSNTEIFNMKSTLLSQHTFMLQDMHVTPNSSYIFTCSQDKTLKQWCSKTHLLIHSYPHPHKSPISSLAISHDSLSIFTGSHSGTLHQFNISTQTLVLTLKNLHSSTISALEVHPNDQTIFTGSHDSTIKEIDFSRGKFTRDFGQTHTDKITCLKVACLGN